MIQWIQVLVYRNLPTAGHLTTSIQGEKIDWWATGLVALLFYIFNQTPWGNCPLFHRVGVVDNRNVPASRCVFG